MAISSKPTSRYRILAARFNEVLQFPTLPAPRMPR
jgi:hypothetical protein